MKGESLMWKTVRPILIAAKLDPVRVENPIHPGTPDVNFATGQWMELKRLPKAPSRTTTRLRIPHYTPQQRVWLYRRWKYSPGSTLLLLEIHSEGQWLLFDGDVAARIVGKSTMRDHCMNARAVLGTRDLGELPKAIAAAIPVPASSSTHSLSCTGSFVHDEFTRCPVHDR